MVFTGDRQKVDLYLQGVDEIQKSMSSASISATDGGGEGTSIKRKSTPSTRSPWLA
ncbi:hypothetical protein LINPERPRIM_LOCUS40885 [Linum perenne]